MGRSRKRARRAADAGTGRPPAAAREPEAPARSPSRSEARNAEARARLVPLAPGERPLAVTIGAVLAAALALAEPVFFVFADVDRSVSTVVGALLFTVLMAAMAWGLWQARYWAVLGLQALLGLLIVIFGLLIVFASNVQAALTAIAVLVPAGALFWFLVKALARIQMPRRP